MNRMRNSSSFLASEVDRYHCSINLTFSLKPFLIPTSIFKTRTHQKMFKIPTDFRNYLRWLQQLFIFLKQPTNKQDRKKAAKKSKMTNG